MTFVFRRLWAASIWHPDAIPVRERKYRSLKRFWLPVYDLFAVAAGVSAMLFGSLLLDRIYGDAADIVGSIFAAVAVICLVGVSFPRLWAVEIVGKALLVGMVIAYMAAIVLSPSVEHLAAREAPNWFVVSVLALGLPTAMFRLTLLAEEFFERKVRANMVSFAEDEARREMGSRDD